MLDNVICADPETVPLGNPAMICAEPETVPLGNAATTWADPDKTPSALNLVFIPEE